MTIDVVGGVYKERCLRPKWEEVYGSAGRAAVAIAQAGNPVRLHSYLTSGNREIINSYGAMDGFEVVGPDVPESAEFHYVHGLITPLIKHPETTYEPISISSENIVRFGMIEGNAIVHCTYAVYDPQNVRNPESFHANGSTAEHLALVLNRYEAGVMSGTPNATPEAMAQTLSQKESADVVIIKMGPHGALVYSNGTHTIIPLYLTSKVWKIGSGDVFVAHFARAWIQEKQPPSVAAGLASKATAYYCENRGFPDADRLLKFQPNPLTIGKEYQSGKTPMVYLAGPFFTLAQLWIVDEARKSLIALGLNVFSPYHDIGYGSAQDVVEKDIEGIRQCDLLFAIADGMDSGTIFEVGYARSLAAC